MVLSSLNNWLYLTLDKSDSNHMRSALFLLVLFLFATPYKGVSQKYKNKEVSLISFNISIHPEAKNFFDQFESQFPAAKNSNADRIISKLKEQAWGAINFLLTSP